MFLDIDAGNSLACTCIYIYYRIDINITTDTHAKNGVPDILIESKNKYTFEDYYSEISPFWFKLGGSL